MAIFNSFLYVHQRVYPRTGTLPQDGGFQLSITFLSSYGVAIHIENGTRFIRPIYCTDHP